MKAISIFAMSRKGYAVIKDLLGKGFSDFIDFVVIAHDKNMANDYYEDMCSLCIRAGIKVYDRNEPFAVKSLFCIAVSWRWIIPISNNSKLIVFHDSLLPKYRGFSPLVNMLINREPFIGVSAIFANKEYDKGEIIAQCKVKINYPVKISDAINAIIPLYSQLVVEIVDKIIRNDIITTTSQDESKASYSLWRDEDDYRINWNSSASDIQQFVYSVGFPFKGAATVCDGVLFRVFDCEVVRDVMIENRDVGKVVFVDNGFPVVVCKSGLIKITDLRAENGDDCLPLKKFRVRFH